MDLALARFADSGGAGRGGRVWLPVWPAPAAGQAAPSSDATRRELKRAQAIVIDLEKIAQRVRRELALHHANLAHVQTPRGRAVARVADAADWQLLCDEAERLLKPTQDLAMQLAHAYDGIRQQSSRLMTFSGQRCDPLTGLCNRQALDETLENYLTMHRRYGMLFSVAVFDLDHFKAFNEKHGHVHGDRLLKQVAVAARSAGPRYRRRHAQRRRGVHRRAAGHGAGRARRCLPSGCGTRWRGRRA